jgi:hypothetical protein
MAEATEQVIDFETMPLDEIRRLAEEEARKQSTAPGVEDLTKTGPVEPEQEVEEPVRNSQTANEQKPTPKAYQAERTIDLGDGSGVQLFRGKGESREAALEDLADKMATAQFNATKKIRELNEKAKAVPAEPQVSEADRAILSQQILSDPEKAIDAILKKRGIDVQAVKEATEYTHAQKVAGAKKAAADSFVAANPDFADTPRNGKLINKWCELHNDFSFEGLTKAYQDLNESGLLDVKGEEAGVGQVEVKQQPRIEETVEDTPPQRTRKASGLSTQRRVAPPVPATPTEDDLYDPSKYSIEDIRRLALEAERSAARR